MRAALDSAALLLVLCLCLFADSIMGRGVGVFAAVSVVTLCAAELLHRAAEKPYRAREKPLAHQPTKAECKEPNPDHSPQAGAVIFIV